MDIAELKKKMKESAEKYRYVIIVLLAGLILMLLPESPPKNDEQQEISAESVPALQDTLAEILSLVHGAGKVKVLLTQERGAQIVYQADTNTAQDTQRSSTVLVSDSAREETGLVKQIISPTYRGAIILSQGADNANVRLSIMEAVKSVTGLTYDRITILKMK